MDDKAIALNRWRLMLGRHADTQLAPLPLQYAQMDQVLDYLYDREYDEARGGRQGGMEASQLTVPSWIAKIRELFPQSTVEVLEKHALSRYNMTELLTDRDVLEKLEPNVDLLKSILGLKHLMQDEVLHTARRIVKQVADEIAERLEQGIRESLLGRRDRNRSGGVKSARNIDFKRTIRDNLKHYDPATKQLLVDKMHFNRRVQRYNPWHVIIGVDESGSMIESVIHSAVMAGIFAKLPILKTNLVIFDTEVVDLSGYVDDPVQTLMSVQLGGGTNITKALTYCQSLIDNPHRTIVVLVTDLFEGGGYERMYSRAQAIVESGARLIVLASLDLKAVPVYDKRAAEIMAALGADVAALTPEGLAKWIANVIS